MAFQHTSRFTRRYFLKMISAATGVTLLSLYRSWGAPEPVKIGFLYPLSGSIAATG